VRLAVAGTTVYAAAPSGTNRQLQAYAAAGCGAPTCAPLWTASTPATISTPHHVVAGGVAYLPGGDGIEAHAAGGCGSATCTANATIPFDSAVTSVVVSGGQLYAVAGGTLTAFAPA
jgi:hypothetical protein